MPRKQWLDELADENVTMLLEGKRWEHWNDLEVSLSLDTFSTLGFTAPFDPERRDLREAFEPFSFKAHEIRVDDELLFNGRLTDVSPDSSSESTSIKLGGYSLPAVAHDCTSPVSTVPHVWEKVSLRTIAEQLMQPFGVDVDFRGVDYTFAKAIRQKQGQKIFEFLTELSKQSGNVYTNTPDGKLLIWAPVRAGHPVATLDTAVNPFEIKAEFKSSDYFSEITGYNPASRKKAGMQWTERNPFLSVLRPESFDLNNVEEGDAQAATKAKMGRMFGNMATWTIEDLPTWRDPSGALFRPNTTIEVRAPRAMIYNLYELVIRTVRFKKSAGKFSATLELVLPGSFSGKLPAILPWQLV